MKRGCDGGETTHSSMISRLVRSADPMIVTAVVQEENLRRGQVESSAVVGEIWRLWQSRVLDDAAGGGRVRTFLFTT